MGAQPLRKPPVVATTRLRLRQPAVAPAPAPAPAPRKRRIWIKPVDWFQEEAFWRDVTKSAVSTGVVALIAYLYALGAGYVSSPTGWQTVRGVLNVVLTAVVGIALGTAMLWGPIVFDPEKFKHRPMWVQRLVKFISWVLAVFVGLSMFQVLSGAFNDVWWAWPFNTPFFHTPMANEPNP